MEKKEKEYFKIEFEHLGEDKIFPFHLYVFQPGADKYFPFLFANGPLDNDKEQLLQLIVEKGGKIAVDMKQKKTFLTSTGNEEADIEDLSPREIHFLSKRRLEYIEKIEKENDKESFAFKTELHSAIQKDDFTNIIKRAHDLILTLKPSISHTVSLAIFLAEKFLTEDSYLARTVALSYFTSVGCKMDSGEIIGDVVCCAFFSHLGYTQIDRALSHLPTLDMDDTQKNNHYKHPGLAQHLLRKNKVDLSKKCIDGILEHHERYDGKGYPGQKKGDFIEPVGLIVGAISHILEFSSGKIASDTKPINSVLLNMKNKIFTAGLEFEFGDTIYEYLISLLNVSMETTQAA